MTVRQILRMGHPVLQLIAPNVTEFNTAILDTLIDDMFETMRSAGGVGLAAPQIGASSRIVIFGFGKNARYPDAEPVPETILINPIITALSDMMEENWEGCLSVPGLRGMVPRFNRIRYQGFDRFGNIIDREAQGFHARVVQHECDHLNGVLYPSRITDFSNFGFEDILFPELAEAPAK